MSFEFEKETLKIYEPLKAANVKTVVDTDIIVPDTKPDVLNILEVNAVPSILEKYIQNDRISVSGIVDYNILYGGGEEKTEVKSIRYKAPFNEQIEIQGIDEDSQTYILCNVSHTEGKIQNSRKINVKSVISFECGAARKSMLSCISNVSGKINLPSKSLETKILNMSVCQEGKFKVTDELKLPVSPDDIGEILKTDVKIVAGEIKTMNNKIVVKGKVLTDTLYTAEGEMYHMENETPFTEVLDAEGINVDMHTEIILSRHGEQIELSAIGEETFLEFTGEFDVLVKAYEENTYEVISDIYSPDYEISTERSNHTIRSLKDSFKETFTINEMINIGDSVPGIVKIYNVIATPIKENVASGDGYLTLNGYLDTKILYLSDSKSYPVYSISKRIPFSVKIDDNLAGRDDLSEANLTLEHINYVIKSERDIDIRANIKVEGKIISEKNMEFISDVNVDLDAPIIKSNQAGITIYFAQEGEDLWDIAKRYNTTSEEIATVNNISEDYLSKKQQLLIPKRVITENL